MPDNSEEYEVKVSWDGKSGGTAHFNKGHSFKIDTPIKYGGQEKGLCPDELFFASIAGCLTTTFLFFKRKLRLEIKKFEIVVQGEIESHGSKGYFIGRVRAIMRIWVNNGEEERAQRCSDLAKEYCHITRSIERSLPIEILSEIIAN